MRNNYTPMPLLSPFGKYDLTEFLGGGMSHVYKARDTVMGHTVALKVLTDEGCCDDETRKRFLLEARTSASLIHDNIIRIYDYGEIGGRPYMVMEFLSGLDLRLAIDKGVTGDVRQKLTIALQAARALAFVHTKSIIHRDLKPENLHIDESGRVRLMDFGIAKTPNLNITREGFSIGTPYYMAPEQVIGGPATPSADIYSFGIVVYELFTAVKPITGDTVEGLFFQILHQQLDMLPLMQAAGPQELVNLVDRCTAKKPEERPNSFEVVISELEAILGRLGTLAQPQKNLENQSRESGKALQGSVSVRLGAGGDRSTKRPWCVAIVVGTVAFASAFGAWGLLGERPRPVPLCANCRDSEAIDDRAEPMYTEQAQRARVEGDVILSGIVGVDGLLTNLRVVRSLGYGLDEAAIEAAGKWKYRPAVIAGKPVVSAITITFSFKRKQKTKA